MPSIREFEQIAAACAERVAQARTRRIAAEKRITELNMEQAHLVQEAARLDRQAAADFAYAQAFIAGQRPNPHS